MSSSEKNTKIYGAVETETFMTFEGFCKKIYNTEQQEIEVFIDDKKIDKILANQKIPNIEDTYEVFDTEGFCFTYKLPEEYIGEKHKLEFKTINGEQLVHSPITTIERDNPLFNRGLLIQSLDEDILYDIMKDGYEKNTITFIAIEENLKDEDFIEYILRIFKLYDKLQLNIIYFKDTEKDLAKKLFNKIKNKTFSNPSSLKEIVSNSEIYIHNYIEEFQSNIHRQFYNKLKDCNIIKSNLFVIELTKKAKEKDLSELILNCLTPIAFENSIISEIFKDDKRINEFKFINSLSQIDKREIKNIYSPNCIGFLATEENLEDEEFVSYIEDLAKNFPYIKIRGLYFNNKQKKLCKNNFKYINNIEYLIISSIYDLIKNIEVYIHNTECFNSFIASKTQQIFLYQTLDIFVINFNYKLFNLTLEEHSSLVMKKGFPFYDSPHCFGFSDSDIKLSKGNVHKLISYKIPLNENFKIDLSTTLRQNSFNQINIVLKNDKYKKDMNMLHTVFKKLIEQKND